MAELVRSLPDMRLPFDCPNCTDDDVKGDREIVEMRRWRSTSEDGGEWVHYMACDACGFDLTVPIAQATAEAIAREERRRGRIIEDPAEKTVE